MYLSPAAIAMIMVATIVTVIVLLYLVVYLKDKYRPPNEFAFLDDWLGRQVRYKHPLFGTPGHKGKIIYLGMGKGKIKIRGKSVQQYLIIIESGPAEKGGHCEMPINSRDWEFI
jgi:hypothetical protein